MAKPTVFPKVFIDGESGTTVVTAGHSHGVLQWRTRVRASSVTDY